MSDANTPVPAGWYPDPSGQPRQRYWDGTAWTEYYHPPLTAPAATPEKPKTSANPEKPKKKRGLLIGVIAGSVALVVGVTSFLVFGLPALTGGPNGAVTSNPDWDYSYTQPVENVEPDHEFEFPAKYDLDALARENAANSENPDIRDTSFAFEVFYDPAFTFKAEVSVMQLEPGEPVRITSQDSDTAISNIDGLQTDIAEGWRWGLHSEYFLMRKLDENGVKLDKPVVTRFTAQPTLASPVVSFGAPDNSGYVTLTWQPVDRATDYYVITSRIDPDTNARLYYLLGQTSDPTWSSSESVTSYDEDDPFNTPFVSTQNATMQMYSGSSVDDLAGGYVREGYAAQFDYGVIASDGSEFSPYIPYDAVSIASGLPYEVAFNTARQLKNWGASGYIDGIENVQKTLPFTALDGTTRSTVATIDAADVRDYGDRWVVALMGRGTKLGEWVPISKSSTPDISSAVAQFNADAAAAAPTTGMPQFEVISGSIDQAAQGVKDAPATEYPIYGSNEFVRFLAAQMIAQTPVVDISDYAGKPGMPDVLDAAYEALYQNPYAISIGGIGPSEDGTKLYLTYLKTQAQAQDVQAQIKAKSDEVVASVITDGMSAADKVTALNDWLTANAEYDYAALEAKDIDPLPEEFEDDWNARGILVNGLGVCASYAYAFNALANAAGIQTVVVTGDVLSGGRHAWNKVNIDGRWLAVDVTWNDSSNPNRYLMIDDSEFTDNATRIQDKDWMSDLVLTQYATS